MRSTTENGMLKEKKTHQLQIGSSEDLQRLVASKSLAQWQAIRLRKLTLDGTSGTELTK